MCTSYFIVILFFIRNIFLYTHIPPCISVTLRKCPKLLVVGKDERTANNFAETKLRYLLWRVWLHNNFLQKQHSIKDKIAGPVSAILSK